MAFLDVQDHENIRDTFLGFIQEWTIFCVGNFPASRKKKLDCSKLFQ